MLFVEQHSNFIVSTNEVTSAYIVALSDVETPPSFMPRNEQHTF